MKNIPIPSRNTYIKKLIEKTESVIKRILWKAFFFEQNKDKNKKNRIIIIIISIIIVVVVFVLINRTRFLTGL